MNVIVDTDVLLGLYNSGDIHHSEAVELAKKVLEKKMNIFILPTTLGEFALLASSKIGKRDSQKAISHLMNSDFLTTDITLELTKEAIELYEKQTSKEESLFDCFIMATAKKLFCDGIFSFDKGYRKNGFKLIEELI